MVVWLLFVVAGSFLSPPSYGQAVVGQSVPDVSETNCQGVSERIYDVLAAGKPILVFKTDMICSNTTAWGTTIRQFATLHASTYRTWVCADFEEANSSSEQCTYMQQYEQQTGLHTAPVFRFIDEVSVGPYDPHARKGLDQILCYQGYIVIGLDSTIVYVGNSMMGAVNAALSAAQVTGNQLPTSSGPFRIFPNPAQDFLRIESDQALEKVDVLDAQGRLVLTQHGDSGLLGLPTLLPGLYTVLARTHSGQTLKQTFIKK